jgi:demethoxyubiquinone hydroxylase (CLK1/Coq7/Cat5 family)
MRVRSQEEEARVERLPEDKDTGLPVPPSLLRVLWAQFGTQILGVASCFKAGVIAMAFCVPIVFNQLITHLEKKDQWEGAANNYGYAAHPPRVEELLP